MASNSKQCHLVVLVAVVDRQPALCSKMLPLNYSYSQTVDLLLFSSELSFSEAFFLVGQQKLAPSIHYQPMQ